MPDIRRRNRGTVTGISRRVCAGKEFSSGVRQLRTGSFPGGKLLQRLRGGFGQRRIVCRRAAGSGSRPARGSIPPFPPG